MTRCCPAVYLPMTSSPSTPQDPASPPSAPRKKRFRREPEGRIQITDRDIAVLQQVHRHRFLRSTHLQALLEGGQGLVRRLAELYHHGFLDRPREQIEYYTYSGSKPMVYALGNQGAKVLAQHCGVPRGKVNWTAKNHRLTSLFLDHTLLIADVMVALELACRAHGAVRLLLADELLARAPEETQRRKNPLQWAVSCHYQNEAVTLGVVPDAIFGLHFTDRPEGRNRAYFFLEADRATMPVRRTNPRQTSFFRKLVAYYETWKQGIHTSVYGIKNFRVLTVTSSPERVANLIVANRGLPGGQGSKLFLFTDEASLHAAPDFLALDWHNGHDGQLIRLGE